MTADLNTEAYDRLGTEIVDSSNVWTRARLIYLSFCFGLGLFVLILVLIVIGVLADAFLGIRVLREIELTLFGIAVLALTYTVWGMARWRIQLGTFSRRMSAAMGAAGGITCVPCLVIILDLFQEFARLYKSWPPFHVVAPILLFPVGAFLVWLLIISGAWLFVEDARPFRIQHGSCCPQCGYCVRGVPSCVCPECGRTFNRDDLGLSESAFEQLISGNAARGDFLYER